MFQEISTALLAEGYSVRFRPSGHSMSPVIRDGEAVTVAPIRACQVRRGDIILYRAERGLIAHRVTQLTGETGAHVFITRGDSATSCDAPVTAQQVLGKVICVERNGRPQSLYGLRARLLWRSRPFLSRLKARLHPLTSLMGTRMRVE